MAHLICLKCGIVFFVGQDETLKHLFTEQSPSKSSFVYTNESAFKTDTTLFECTDFTFEK